jgi:hypothetical protein
MIFRNYFDNVTLGYVTLSEAKSLVPGEEKRFADHKRDSSLPEPALSEVEGVAQNDMLVGGLGNYDLICVIRPFVLFVI